MVRWRSLAVLLDLVVPPTCAGCGIPGPGICEGCATATAAAAAPVCHRCGHPWSQASERCAECPPALDRLQFAASYDPPVPDIVTAFKHLRHGRRGLAGPLADLIVARCAPPPAGATLVPVPLTTDRHRERGYNQAALLARALALRWEVPTANLLKRVRDDPPQRGASRTDRALHVRGAFGVARGVAVPGEVWLVDDVVTTGATLAACARTLRRAGVRRVEGVAAARVLRGVRAVRSSENEHRAQGGASWISTSRERTSL